MTSAVPVRAYRADFLASLYKTHTAHLWMFESFLGIKIKNSGIKESILLINGKHFALA